MADRKSSAATTAAGFDDALIEWFFLLHQPDLQPSERPGGVKHPHPPVSLLVAPKAGLQDFGSFAI